MPKQFFLAAFIAFVVSACARETSAPPVGHDATVVSKLGEAKDKELAAANDVITAILSGDIAKIPSNPPPCGALRADILTAAGRTLDGTYNITGRSTATVRGRTVSVLHFEGAAADMALLDAIKTGTDACYVGKGTPGDFVVVNKTDLGAGKWRYAMDPSTATLTASLGGSQGNSASAQWDSDLQPVDGYKWSLTCSPLAGRVGGEPVWTNAAAEGTQTDLRIIKGSGCPPTMGKAL